MSTQILGVQDIDTQLRMDVGVVNAIKEVPFTTGDRGVVESWVKATAESA